VKRHSLWRSRGARSFILALLAVALAGLGGGAALPLLEAKDRFDYSAEFKAQLRYKWMPYWYDTAQDKQNGGYVLSDDSKGRGQAVEKQLVTQSRMIWGFSHAHLHGCSDDERNYLKAAAQGFRFLQNHFQDKTNGGYFWKTDLTGQVTNDRKIVYGQAFVIYALVEYVRASGDLEALRTAQALYQTLQKRAYDAKNGGWMEHFQRDWQPILKPEPGAEVEVPGYKSANTHLHLMEALAELAEITNDASVKKSLSEAIRLNVKYFYPKQPGKSCFHRQPDWKPVTDPKSAGLSYGHNVEFAWLMIRAEAVLNRKPSWSHFEAHLRHALNYGFDQSYGGLYARGDDDQPATDTDKIWWVQAEMLAALTVAVQHRAEPVYTEALDKLLEFVRTYQADQTDGIWLDTVTAEGKPKNTAKAHNWKANYHDVRALVKFTEAFPSSDQTRKIFRNR
jgi:mannobiose 2-epimerase